LWIFSKHPEKLVLLRSVLRLPSNPPLYILILGVIAILAAVVFACTGKVWVRFNGWVYRAKEPGAFWGEVAVYFLVGLCFVGYFLFEN
jgi:hypothetical protein